MGHTNSTANYNLPQFVGTDKPSWLGDINDAFAAIDTAIAAAASEASTADGKADALGTTVSGHTTQIGTLQNTVTSQGNTLNTVTSLIGNGTPTTTDQTIIGAINEINANEIADRTSVIATAAANQTFSQQLTELYTSWQTLSDSKKVRAYLKTGPSIFRIANMTDASFFNSVCDATNVYTSCMILSSGKFYGSTGVTVADSSSANNNLVLELFA